MRMTWAADALCDDCWAKAHPLRPALSADWDDESFEHRDRLLLIFCRTECRTIYRSSDRGYSRSWVETDLVLVDCTTTRTEGVSRYGQPSDFGPFCSTCGTALEP
jgi:hypothetical protein